MRLYPPPVVAMTIRCYLANPARRICVAPVTRVRSQGTVTLSVNVLTKDLAKLGYRVTAATPVEAAHA